MTGSMSKLSLIHIYTGAALLDAIVLAVVSRSAEGAYGYKITQEVRQVIELSESTLYPVLRCLLYTSFQDAGNRQYALSQTERTGLACAFLDEVAAAGYTPMFYASRNELAGNASWDTDILASRYKIWLAWYPSVMTEQADYSGSYAMWQYTCQGTVDGISGKTDINTAYFSYTKEAEAKDDTPAERVTVNPEVGINFTEVNETVTAKQETNLRTEPSTASDDTIVGKLKMCIRDSQCFVEMIFDFINN